MQAAHTRGSLRKESSWNKHSTHSCQADLYYAYICTMHDDLLILNLNTWMFLMNMYLPG